MPDKRLSTWIAKMFGRSRPAAQLDCHEVAELLQRYLDGHIDAERAQRIEEHLDDCVRCGLEAETYERIKTALATSRPEVSGEAVDRLRAFGEALMRGEESPAP